MFTPLSSDAEPAAAGEEWPGVAAEIAVELAAEIDDVAIALFPVRQHLESGLELFDAVIHGEVSITVAIGIRLGRKFGQSSASHAGTTTR